MRFVVSNLLAAIFLVLGSYFLLLAVQTSSLGFSLPTEATKAASSRADFYLAISFAYFGIGGLFWLVRR